MGSRFLERRIQGTVDYFERDMSGEISTEHTICRLSTEPSYMESSGKRGQAGSSLHPELYGVGVEGHDGRTSNIGDLLAGYRCSGRSPMDSVSCESIRRRVISPMEYRRCKGYW